jgi:hypothetical protein
MVVVVVVVVVMIMTVVTMAVGRCSHVREMCERSSMEPREQIESRNLAGSRFFPC